MSTCRLLYQGATTCLLQTVVSMSNDMSTCRLLYQGAMTCLLVDCCINEQ
jgi:hypothetical protein